MRQMCRRQFFMLINAARREDCPLPFPPLSLSSTRSVSSHPSQVHCICILSQFSYCPVRCSVLSPLGIFFVLFHHIHQQTLLIRHVRQQRQLQHTVDVPSFLLPLPPSVSFGSWLLDFAQLVSKVNSIFQHFRDSLS